MNQLVLSVSLCCALGTSTTTAQVSPDVIAREAAAMANKGTTGSTSAASAAAPTLPSTPSNALPARNVLIEVRQVQQNSGERTGIETNPRVDIGSNGQVGLSGQLQVQRRQSSQSTSARQTAMVLNGYSTRISLGNSTPVRLMQTVVRNGVVFITQGTVLLDNGTGFVATPRWSGADRVELEISAQQTQNTGSVGNIGMGPQSGFGAGQGSALSRQVSSTSSTLVLPLDVWTTIAQTEQTSSGNTTRLGGGTRESTSSGSDVQIRLTIK